MYILIGAIRIPAIILMEKIPFLEYNQSIRDCTRYNNYCIIIWLHRNTEMNTVITSRVLQLVALRGIITRGNQREATSNYSSVEKWYPETKLCAELPLAMIGFNNWWNYDQQPSSLLSKGEICPAFTWSRAEVIAMLALKCICRVA